MVMVNEQNVETGRFRVKRFQGVYSRPSSKRIFQGKPDRCFDISYKDQRGRLFWEKVGWVSEGYTAAMASQVRGERIRSIRHGKELPDRRKGKSEKTLREIWADEYKQEKGGKKSYQDDCWRCEKHIMPVFGGKKLSEISSAMLNNFKNSLIKEKGLSAQSVTHLLNLIKSVFNVALRNGAFEGQNPVCQIEYPSTRNTNRLRYLDRDETDRLFDELKASSQTIYEMAYVSLYTGMRADEIFSLRWEDIDFENKVMHILETKNTESRTAFIIKSLLELFENKKKGRPHEFVFPQELRRGNGNKKKEQVKKNQIGNTFRRVVEKLKLNEGIEDRRYRVCFHTLRHTFGSWLAIRGESLQTIKELMGHKRISQTQRYAHLSPDLKRQAVERLQERD